MEFSHVHRLYGLDILLSNLHPRKSARRVDIPRKGEGWGPLRAQVQLTGQPAITYSRRPPPAISSNHMEMSILRYSNS